MGDQVFRDGDRVSIPRISDPCQDDINFAYNAGFQAGLDRAIEALREIEDRLASGDSGLPRRLDLVLMYAQSRAAALKESSR